MRRKSKKYMIFIVIVMLLITFFINSASYADTEWLKIYESYSNYTGVEAFEEDVLSTMISNLNSLTEDDIDSLTNEQKELCQKLITIINNDANKNYRNANQSEVAKLAEFEKKLTGSSTTTSNANKDNTNNNTNPNTAAKGAEYWHSDKIQTLLEQNQDYKTFDDSTIEALENYFSNATLVDLQALTSSDVDTIIHILDAIATNSPNLKQDNPKVAEGLKVFSIRLQTVNIDGKHIASDSQIAQLKKIQDRLTEVQEISEAEQHNQNVIQDVNTAAVNPDDLQIVEDNLYSSGVTGGLLGNPDNNTNHTLGEIIKEAIAFLTKDEGNSTINENNLKGASDTLYNILLGIGIAAALIIGIYLGIKFMMSSAEDKAKVKESLIPYIAGCVVVFSGFIIWKLVIILLGNIA